MVTLIFVQSNFQHRLDSELLQYEISTHVYNLTIYILVFALFCTSGNNIVDY